MGCSCLCYYMNYFWVFKITAGDNVAHWAHLGGGLVGLLLVFYWRKTDRQNFY